MPSNEDLHILISLNAWGNASNLGLQFWSLILVNPLVRGIPVFLPLVALWFSGESRLRRSRILAGLLATALSVALSFVCQIHTFHHVRPFLDPAVHLQGIDPVWAANWNRLGSFPSDTATLFFALATVVFLENRIAGCIAFLASFVTVGLDRVILGWHYPSDIAGGLILGAGTVYLFSRIRPLNAAIDRLLARCEPCICLVHALLFLFLADAYVLFAGLQGFCHCFRGVASYLIKRL